MSYSKLLQTMNTGIHTNLYWSVEYRFYKLTILFLKINFLLLGEINI